MIKHGSEFQREAVRIALTSRLPRKRLAGHQVIALARAFTVIINLDVSEMTREDERAVAHTLRRLGYEERWVAK